MSKSIPALYQNIYSKKFKRIFLKSYGYHIFQIVKKQIALCVGRLSSNYCVNLIFYEQMTETHHHNTVINVGSLVITF